MKMFLKLRKRAMAYLKNHVEYNALIHMLAGVGLGLIITHPLADPHPVRWGLILIGLSLVGHLFTVSKQK